MAEEKLSSKINSVLVSGRADETLAYSKHIKDYDSGESVKQQLDERVKKTDQLVTDQLADSAVTTPKLAPQSVTNDKLSTTSVSTDKIQDSSVTTEKLNDRAVTTEKLEEKSVTNPKLADQSVDGRTIRESTIETKHLANESVSTEKIARQSVTNDKLAPDSVDTSKVINGSVTNPKLANASVSTDKLQDRSVTNDKIANDTLTMKKFDPELRKSLEAATGLPEDILEMIQDVDENLAKLNDTVYPITLSLSLSPNLATMQTDVKYTVSSDGKPFLPDTLDLRKNNAILSNTPSASGTVSTPIQANKEVFTLLVTKEGRTSKSTNLTRYLCYCGGNPAATMTAEIINALTKVSSPSVSFNPSLKTKSGDYIWLVVPSYLTISRVTSAGFDVTLAAPQIISTAIGEFKAYRSANTLTESTWNLVIS